MKFSTFYKPTPSQPSKSVPLITKIAELQKLFIDRYEIITMPGGSSSVDNKYYLKVQEAISSYFEKYVQKP